MSELLTFTMNKKASDLHISAGMPPIIRIDGDMYRINLPPFDRQTVLGLIEDVMNEKQKKIYKEDLEIDFSYKIPDGSRFRVNAFNQYRGPAAAFRSIPAKLMKLEEIGCASKLKDIVNTPSGLVLVTGPTGSGKSTTLSALIDYKNNREYKNILTIEDPVEYFHKSKKCLINQREVFRNTHGFNKALYSALREDPDIILIGELRNLETIKLALTAAETGHLVFGTLHTSSAPQTIDRIIDVFSAEEKTVVRYMLSQSLRAVISQTLVKRKGGGRVAAMEIMVTTSPIRNLIRQEKISQIYSTIQLARDEGMQTLEQHLQVLIEHGIISSEEAYSKALNRQALEISIADSKGKQ
ncbi:MAG: type IV pilus twitching motility protein PilT [Elusimicrobiota bacterium]